MADPTPVKDLGKSMMNQAFVVTAMVLLIFYFVYTGKVQPDEPVTLEITATQGTTEPGKDIPVTVAVKLSNNTKEGMSLTVPTQCDTFNWFLTGPDKEFVQAKGTEDVCPKTAVSTWLEGEKAMQENFVLQLDPARVRPGEYKLFMRYWGHEMTQDITIR